MVGTSMGLPEPSLSYLRVTAFDHHGAHVVVGAASRPCPAPAAALVHTNRWHTHKKKKQKKKWLFTCIVFLCVAFHWSRDFISFVCASVAHEGERITKYTRKKQTKAMGDVTCYIKTTEQKQGQQVD